MTSSEEFGWTRRIATAVLTVAVAMAASGAAAQDPAAFTEGCLGQNAIVVGVADFEFSGDWFTYNNANYYKKGEEGPPRYAWEDAEPDVTGEQIITLSQGGILVPLIEMESSIPGRPGVDISVTAPGQSAAGNFRFRVQWNKNPEGEGWSNPYVPCRCGLGGSVEAGSKMRVAAMAARTFPAGGQDFHDSRVKVTLLLYPNLSPQQCMANPEAPPVPPPPKATEIPPPPEEEAEGVGEVEWIRCVAPDILPGGRPANWQPGMAGDFITAAVNVDPNASTRGLRLAQSGKPPIAGKIEKCIGGGEVYLVDSAGKIIRSLTEGQSIFAGETIRTSAKVVTRIRIHTEGGGQTLITIPPESKARFPTTKNTASGLRLFFGKLLSVFTGPPEFIEYPAVVTDNAITSREGTIYEVEYDEVSRATRVAVAEGRVRLSCITDPEIEHVILPGEEAVLDESCRFMMRPLSPVEVEDMIELANFVPRDLEAGDPTGHLGCFKDGGQTQSTTGRDIDGHYLDIPGLTPEACIAECSARGFAYAGVQYGRQCFCGDSYGRMGPSDGCTYPCEGDPSRTCGGFYANNVYATDGSGSDTDEPEPPAGNLVTNGSFEEGPPVGNWLLVEPGSTDLPGWTVSRNNIDIDRLDWKHPDGERSIDLNGNSGPGELSQTLDTQPGQRYRLSFYLAGNAYLGAYDMRLLVTVGDQSRVFTFNTGGHSLQSMGWRQETLDFTAESTRTTLVFASQTDHPPNTGPVIDDVRVTALD